MKYRHKKSGKIYDLLYTANVFASPDKKDKYPTLTVYQDVSKRKGTELSDLSYGERVALPDTATIIRRFPRL